MPRIIEYIRIARRLPLRTALSKASALVGRQVGSYRKRRCDLRATTYSEEAPAGRLFCYFSAPDIEVLRTQANPIRELSARYLEHRFDLLGSGWTKVSGTVRCRGLEGSRYTDRDVGRGASVNASNGAESERIRTLVGTSFEAIDWHLDFKSGYRWRKDIWYQDVPYGHLPGVDIKIPWELARMQHLPMLAWAFALSGEGAEGFEKTEAYVQEFRNQVLDFIAENPPRYGVNWRCTMDVGIRIANWLTARDLLLAGGATFDDAFENVFARSVFEHARHIVSNLEWDPEFRANHYFADIVGLLYAAAYLPRSRESDAWLAFAIQELVGETQRQFLPDGGNFEGSTAYHRLSAEMALHATAIVLALPPEKQAALNAYDQSVIRGTPGLDPAPNAAFPLPSTHFEPLAKAAAFSAEITKADGRIPQFGDNDSGRFLKFAPVGKMLSVADAKAKYASLDGYDELPDDATVWDEDHLDHRPMIAGFAGLFDGIDRPGLGKCFEIETMVVEGLAGKKLPVPETTSAVAKMDIPRPPKGRVLLDAEIRVPGGLLECLECRAFPDFGLYVWRSERLFLAVRCGAVGQNGRGGHAHHDQLSLALAINGEDWISDPGTYLYTPSPEQRNAYRSVNAHFAPKIGKTEPGRLDLGLFWLGNDAQGRCLAHGPDGFLGTHAGFKRPVFRWVGISEGVIRIRDILADQSPTGSDILPDTIVVSGRDATRATFQPTILSSPGYGLLLNRDAAS